MRRSLKSGVLWVVVAIIGLQSACRAETADQPASGGTSYATWRLLTNEQKQEFLAGYVQGWRDASQVTDVAIDFVRENPNEAVAGLQRLKKLYEMSDLSPSFLAREVDKFFSEPANHSASFALAISAARAHLR